MDAKPSDARGTKMISRQDKAESFISHVKLMAVGSWEPWHERRPHLWQAISERGRNELTFEEKCFKWDFLLVVAMTWWAVNSAKRELPEAEFDQVAGILERQLADWNRGSIAGFSDLNGFVQRYEPQYRKMVNPSEVIDFTKLLVGTWLIWNLTNKAKFDDEAELINLLGNMVYMGVAGYWTIQEAPSLTGRITKPLEIAVNDCDAGRITPVQLGSVFQEAIDNGDILEEENEFCVVARVFPLIDRGVLRRSEHVTTFETRMNAKATTVARELRAQDRRRPWWRCWGATNGTSK